MKKPEFKHKRDNVIAACYGNLTNDAADIAADEIKRLQGELNDWGRDKEEKGIKVTHSEVIEQAFKLGRNPVELMFLGIGIGRAMADQMEMPTMPESLMDIISKRSVPLSDLLRSMKADLKKMEEDDSKKIGEDEEEG